MSKIWTNEWMVGRVDTDGIWRDQNAIGSPNKRVSTRADRRWTAA
jgi:hypothetical protein